MELEQTRELYEHIKADLRLVYILESLRSDSDKDNDPSAARMVTMLKTVRGILRERIKVLEKEGEHEA